MAMYRTVKTSVWWDIENCPVSKGYNANAIALNISSALVRLSYEGPVSISAYGDTNRIPNPIQKALSSTGISLNQVPAGAKDASDKRILVDMLLWAIDNPAPANFLIISGDSSFSNALHQLSMRRYNILLAHPPQASASLIGAAKVIWLWTTLSAGGAPYYIASSGKLPESIHFKTKPKHATNLSRNPTLLPLQVPQQSKNNDVPNNVEPPLPQPLVKSVVKAPREFFSSNVPIITTPNLPSNQDASKNSSHGILHDSHHSRFRQKQSMFGPMHKPNVHEYMDKVLNTASVVHKETREDSTSTTSESPCGGLPFCYEREGLIDVILRALNSLKVEMLLSTERNITDCIRYGDPRYQTFDVRKALDFAIEHHRVEKRILGASHLYVPRNETLWKCVNHTSGHPNDFPQATWDRIKQFLTSSSGRSSILTSQCRYEASLIMRRSCLGELLLGDVLKILHMIITVMEWIKVHHSGWQPITITLMETRGNTDNSTSGVESDTNTT